MSFHVLLSDRSSNTRLDSEACARASGSLEWQGSHMLSEMEGKQQRSLEFLLQHDRAKEQHELDSLFGNSTTGCEATHLRQLDRSVNLAGNDLICNLAFCLGINSVSMDQCASCRS